MQVTLREWTNRYSDSFNKFGKRNFR